MDVIVIGVMALMNWALFFPKNSSVEQIESSVERIQKNVVLNPEMIHDEHAFMVIANELGFH